ncbi:MAG: hypothetical protein C0498_00250 [Anaerolinea sp.]|nr:hypothetical protein [Anaerolinea sp.]
MRRPDLPSVFVDADVLIAGSVSTSGASHLILQLGELGLIDVVSSDQAHGEAMRNITRKLRDASETFERLVHAACRWVPTPRPDDVASYLGEADEKDLPILVAAAQAGCRVLITFNVRDFHPRSLDVVVETPAAFVERLRGHLRELVSPESGTP